MNELLELFCSSYILTSLTEIELGLLTRNEEGYLE